MTKLRQSTERNPILQEEALAFMQDNPDVVFEIAKIKIPVCLIKAKGGETVKTVTLARDGRKIEETTNTADEGFGIDTRRCVDGSVDQYAKKPAKVSSGYTLDDGRLFDEVKATKMVKAHTVNCEVRKAFVAPFDMYLATTWGEVQFIGRGGLVTFMGEEAIGNNNPCDMVLHTPNGNGREVLTSSAKDVRYDLARLGLSVSSGSEKFLSVAEVEDAKNPYISTWHETVMSMKTGILTLQRKVLSLGKKEPQVKKIAEPKAKKTVKKKEKTR